jgi:predicted Rossmann fold nucleotide-binding protein DprA/Smf involved in DNA uptake
MPSASTVRDAERAALALTRVSGVGPVTFRALVDALGSADAVLRAPASVLRGVDGCAAMPTRSGFDQWVEVDAELARLGRGGRLLTLAGASIHSTSVAYDPPSAMRWAIRG